MAEDIQKSQQAIQKIHRRMALMSRKQRKLDSVSFEPENGTEGLHLPLHLGEESTANSFMKLSPTESEVKVSALKSSHVVAGEESNPEQKVCFLLWNFVRASL